VVCPVLWVLAAQAAVVEPQELQAICMSADSWVSMMASSCCPRIQPAQYQVLREVEVRAARVVAVRRVTLAHPAMEVMAARVVRQQLVVLAATCTRAGLQV
jgi:hypothetical protein